MENNFFVGVVVHKNKRGNNLYSEKVVLYTSDNIYYTELINDITYTTNSSNKDYVIFDSLVPTSSDEFRIDYEYLLGKHNDIKEDKVKRRKFFFKR